MTKREAIQFWLRSADDNLATARAMIVSKRWNFAMFMCQQAIEAMLKAVIIRKTGDRPPFIHKLPALADMAGVDLPAELDRALLLIDAHYMKARYFSDRFNKEIYNRKNATELVALTKELMRWLREGAGFKN